MIGAPDSADTSTAGYVYLFFGRPSDSLSSTYNASSLTGANGYRVDGDGVQGKIGYSIGAAGDIDGDDYDDILLSTFSTSNSNTCRAFVIWGKPSDLFVESFDLSSINSSHAFVIPDVPGSSCQLSGIGDINNDGQNDYMIGAHMSSSAAHNFSRNGQSYVFMPVPMKTISMTLLHSDSSLHFVLKFNTSVSFSSSNFLEMFTLSIDQKHLSASEYNVTVVSPQELLLQIASEFANSQGTLLRAAYTQPGSPVTTPIYKMLVSEAFINIHNPSSEASASEEASEEEGEEADKEASEEALLSEKSQEASLPQESETFSSSEVPEVGQATLTSEASETTSSSEASKSVTSTSATQDDDDGSDSMNERHHKNPSETPPQAESNASLDDSTKEKVAVSAATSFEASSQVLVSTQTIGTVVSGGRAASLFTIKVMIDFIQVLRFLNISWPANIQAMFLNSQLDPGSITVPFGLYPTPDETQYHNVAVSDSLEELTFPTYFLVNCRADISNLLVYLMIALLLVVSVKRIPNKEGQLWSVLLRTANLSEKFFAWNFTLVFIMAMYLLNVVFVALELQNPHLETSLWQSFVHFSNTDGGHADRIHIPLLYYYVETYLA